MKGHVLSAVRMHITGAGAHGGAPGVLPKIEVFIVESATGIITSLGSATYVWGGGDPGAYQAGFYLTVSALGHTIDTGTFDYRIELTIESGANYVDFGRLDSIQANVTVNAAEGGPDVSFWP